MFHMKHYDKLVNQTRSHISIKIYKKEREVQIYGKDKKSRR